MSKSNLALLVLNNCKEFGELVEKNLQKIRKEKDTKYIIPITETRFSNGEGKITIDESVRGKDVFIISDVGNYGVEYMCHGRPHIMTPDEHFQDIKRTISATCGNAATIHVVMPLLYASRQHRRKARESLDCAIGLQELERLGIKSILTFDAHDPNVCNSVPNLSLDNVYPTSTIMKQMVKDEPEIFENTLVISPDFGAMDRARYYAEIIGCDVGVFYKRRDLSKVVNGKNPIVEHAYMGSEVKGKNILIVDDMIASGGSIIEVASELRKRGAKKICATCTFALFTEGIDRFLKAKEENLIDLLYTTNLSYIPKEITDYEWFHCIDMSNFVAEIINSMDNKEALSECLDRTRETFKAVRKSISKNGVI